MVGTFTIDGVNSYSSYGVIIVEGGYAGLADYPSLKKFESVDYPEEDGLDADLAEPILDTRNFNVKFASLKGGNIDGFFSKITDGAYHTIGFDEVCISKKLRYVSNGSTTYDPRIRLFSMTFADDFPLEGYTYAAPQKTIGATTDVCIDGVPLSNYSIIITDGTNGSIYAKAAAKENLLTNVINKAGAIYDEYFVKRKTRTVTLQCVMICKSWSQFWQNHDALLYDLTRKNARVLSAGGCTVGNCYFGGCNSDKLTVSGTCVWWEFSLSLTII